MVAFELAELEELAGRIDRATDWYKQAWQRFRRSEWKKKAEDALARHGIVIGQETGESGAPGAETGGAREEREAAAHSFHREPEEQEPSEERVEPATAEAGAKFEGEAQPEQAGVPVAQAGAVGPITEGQSRRRRRRGGRGRGHRGHKHAPVPTPPEQKAPTLREPGIEEIHERPPRNREPERHAAPEPPHMTERRIAREATAGVHVYRRAGEPALASEIKSLEAKLRQLMAAHPDSLEALQELPASPGVYVVSDLDLTTFYYVESYGNIRAAIDQLLSGRRGRQGSVRSRLARYLGIGDNQTTRYLKQHCVVRWLEMEEGDAVSLGHFAIAVLRPKLNEEET